MKKAAVFFPGAGYGMDCPLLYYGDFLLETKGYGRWVMDYQAILSAPGVPPGEKRRQLRDYVLAQLDAMGLEDCGEVVFLSKSVGTALAGWLAGTMERKVTQIFLTPMEEAMAHCTPGCRVVIGTRDPAYGAFRRHCEAQGIEALYIEGADHALEIEGKPYESLEALKQVMEFLERCT